MCATKSWNTAIFPVDHENALVMQGIHTHNLKNIDIALPKNQIITITGVSWSWKSSLAFDTIYKEGQFKYIESLSSYLRQFFNLWARPEVEYTSWLSPAIAIEQNKRVGNSRSTVGTLTELDDYLRLMMAKLWEVYCWKCWIPLKPKNNDQIVADIKSKFFDKKVYLLQELSTYKSAEDLARFVKRNRKKVDQWEWSTRYLLALNYDAQAWTWDHLIEYFYLEDPKLKEIHLPVKVYGIFDRITITDETLSRLREDSIKMLAMADKIGVYWVDNSGMNKESQEPWSSPIKSNDSAMNNNTEESSGSVQNIIRYTDKYYCPQDNIKYPEFTSQHFSANREEWACDTCHGLWQQLQVDFEKVIDPYSPYLQAILPWRDSPLWQAILKKLAYAYQIREETLRKDLPDWFTVVVVQGDNEQHKLSLWWWRYMSIRYKGIEPVLTEQYNKWVLTVDFQAMLDLRPCTSCHGDKLKKESLHVLLQVPKPLSAKEKKLSEQWSDDKQYKMGEDPRFTLYNIAQLQKMPVNELTTVIDTYQKATQQAQVLVQRITKPFLDRAKTIEQLWLGYISTLRQIDTLSWGEIQRMRLAKQLGNKLTWIIYVLDEPTIGLDSAEIEKVIQAIKWLQKMGNTIIVVEHNDEFIKNSDWIVEVGPGAWDFWWRILFSGPYKEFIKTSSLTAQYVTGKKKVHAEFHHKPTNHTLRIKKASKYNLQGIDVAIQLGSFTIITWASGAGKTTLMYHTLFRFLSDKQKFIQWFIRLQLLKEGLSWNEILAAPLMKREKYEHLQQRALQEFYQDIAVESIAWYEEIENVLYVDQSSIWKTPRSCPATFVGLFDDIRKMFAGTTDAKMIWFTPWHFSFNAKKWSCPECDGYGHKKVELQFLPDTYIPCSLCRWQRYKPEILWIKWHGKTISQILDMYVFDAVDFFAEIPMLMKPLALMMEIWLWYLKLWQPAHTLSWWESQRIKLVKHLLKSYKGHTVYFLDEPTVWLHPVDIEKLLTVLSKFLDNGDTILMIEHEKNLLKFADQVIRLEKGQCV
jgi:excinuclease ABC subunit A